MGKFDTFLDRIEDVINYVGAALLLVMVSIVFWQVFARFVLDKPPSWSEEVALVIMLWITFIGAAAGVRRHIHIRVNFFIELMGSADRAVVLFLGFVVVLIFSGYMFFYSYRLSTFLTNVMPATGIPVAWMYLTVAGGAALILLFGKGVLCGAWQDLRKAVSSYGKHSVREFIPITVSLFLLAVILLDFMKLVPFNGMSSTESGTILLISLFFLLLLNGVPISFSLGVAAFITGYYLGLPLMVITQRLAAGINAFAFIAIPFFILAGKIMADGGIAERIVAFANVLVGRIRGGLAMVNIVASMLFGGISGSSVADVASIGPILIPMMEKQGYDKDFSVAVTITSSTEGIIIPPSHNMIIYSLAAGGVSVGQLFLAGYIPGIMIGVSLMIASYIIAVKKDYPRAPKYSFRQAVKITLDAILGLFVAIIIIGGIVSGIFTATEASVVAVVYAMFIGFFAYRTLTLRMFGGILIDAVKMVSMVMFLIASASVFGYLLAYMQVPVLVTNILLSLSHNKYVLLILINIMVLFLGMIMDFAPLVVILTPILLPVVMKLGMTPVQFGIVLMINLAIGLCTPPVGNTLFVGCSVGNTTIERATKASLPFYTAMVAILMLVTFIPQITMLIPSLFYK